MHLCIEVDVKVKTIVCISNVFSSLFCYWVKILTNKSYTTYIHNQTKLNNFFKYIVYRYYRTNIKLNFLHLNNHIYCNPLLNETFSSLSPRTSNLPNPSSGDKSQQTRRVWNLPFVPSSKRYYLPLPKHPTPSIKGRTPKTLKTLFLHIYTPYLFFLLPFGPFYAGKPPVGIPRVFRLKCSFFYSSIPSCIFAYRYPPCTPLPHQNPSITEITSFEKSAAEDFFIIILFVFESSLFRDFFVK